MVDQHNGPTNKAESNEKPSSGGQFLDAEQTAAPVAPTAMNSCTVNVDTEGSAVNEPKAKHYKEPLESPRAERVLRSEKWLMIALTAIIAVATAANVIVFYLESETTSQKVQALSTKAGEVVGAMNKALSNNREAISQAFAENKSALNMSAKQNKEALDASTKQFSDTLRPYVYVTRMTLLGTLAEGKKIQGQAEVINAGRTPAIQAKVCADLALRGANQILSDGYPCPAPGNPPELPHMVHSQTVIGPNSPPVSVESRGTTITPVSRHGVLVPLISSRALRLYFYGDISYAEFLNPKITHHTEFCGVYNIDTNSFDACEHHNNVN